MATIVAVMAMTHSPGLTGWFDAAPKDQQEEALRATAEMRERLVAAPPDVVIAFSNDHLLNWPINNTPEYTVGIAAEHVGPADWYDEWLALSKYRIPGHPALASYIVNEGARRRLALAYLREMKFDDGISVPMHYLNPIRSSRSELRSTMDCTVPRIPTPERAYQVGSVLADLLKANPGMSASQFSRRGALARSRGGPLGYFSFLSGRDVSISGSSFHLKTGDHEALLRDWHAGARWRRCRLGRHGGIAVLDTSRWPLRRDRPR